jgi:hypothetical protein
MLAIARRYSISLLILSISTPAIAQEANFEPLTLGNSTQAATVKGYTSGSYSLSSLANSDRSNRPCIGFAAPTPDHIMVLENDRPKLALQVDSGGKDTTIVVRGPDKNTIRCNLGTDESRDARLEDSDWKAGRYEIWVGSMQSGDRINYRLSAQ